VMFPQSRLYYICITKSENVTHSVLTGMLVGERLGCWRLIITNTRLFSLSLE